MGKKRKVQMTTPVEAELPMTDASDLELPPVETSATAELSEVTEPVTIPEPPAARPVSRWRVLETAQVSLFGHMTTVSAGDIVSAAEYGPHGVERMRDQGVRLEPMV